MSFTHLGAVVAEVADLAERFRDRGFRLFLVGGIVRDQWLDHPLDASSDIDLTTDARPESTKEIVADWGDAVWTQGERFGTIGVQRAGRLVEITTHRAEAYVADSRKPEVRFGDDINDDLARRDFTVNAMAIELPDGELVDPFDGASDLERRVLRTPLSAEISFTDDPLRMLRAARFANRYALTPVDELLDAARTFGDRLSIVSAERIRDELEKLLGSADVEVGLDLLRTTDLLGKAVAGLDGAVADRAVAVANATPAPWWLRLAALIAPLELDDSATAALLGRLRCSTDDAKAIRRVLRAVDSLPVETDDAAIRRWSAIAGDLADEALALAAAGARADGGPGPEPFAAQRLTLLAAEDLADLDPQLDGGEIMALLGLEPGREVGAAVQHLRERRIVHGPQTADDERAALKRWHQAK